MHNPFFKNNGPFKYRDIIKELGLRNDQNNYDQLYEEDSITSKSMVYRDDYLLDQIL